MSRPERARTRRRREAREAPVPTAAPVPRRGSIPRRVALAGSALAAAAIAAAVLLAPSEPPVDGFTVAASHPHDEGAFTQGLVFDRGALLEGTGRRGRSELRRVALESGAVVRRRTLPEHVFGEGVAVAGGLVFQLSYQEGVAFVWDKERFEPVREHRYEGEGWGLAFDGRHLVMSDGSATLAFRDPESFAVERRLEVTSAGRPVTRLNELECIDGEIWANVWQTDRIARIDASTGRVTRWVDLKGLLAAGAAKGRPDVLNGIAWDAEGRRLFVTGKLWPRVYQIEVVPAR